MNQLARNGRTVSSGVIEIFHNRALYKAEHSISNLSFSSNCCYPTSGSISSTFTGLAAKVSACNMGSVAGDSCRAAVDVVCREQGGVGGYGVHDYVGNNVAIGCIRN